MTSIAAKEFKQRKETYDPTEDGLNFKTWYHVQDVQRIIWKKYTQLSPKIKKETLQPYVFFDGLDQLTLEDMLSPLVTILEKSSQKYFPFIFKPELAGVHYIAGFLRKNKDETVSIVFFNPTGTLPRVNYGGYAYAFQLEDPEMEESEAEENVIYFKIEKKTLHYSVIDPEGELRTNSLSPQDLITLGVDLDLEKPLTTEIVRDKLKPKATQILKLTLARGETEEKIEIISSSKKIQTHEKDGGPLVSCGPLSILFIEYVMTHPEYMESLDKDVQLPDILDLDTSIESHVLKFLALEKNKKFNLNQFLDADPNDEFTFPDFLEREEQLNLIEYKKLVLKYRALIMKTRQEHFETLDTIEDSLVEVGGTIDESYSEVTAAILDAHDKKDDEEVLDEQDWEVKSDHSEDWDVESTESSDQSEKHSKKTQLDIALSVSKTKQISNPDTGKTTAKTLETTSSEPKKKVLSHQDMHTVTHQKESTPPINPENRADVIFIRKQISRFRENAKSYFSINNGAKADAIEKALELALQDESKHGVKDVRTDDRVKDALAIHRIFGFFGCKSTTATIELEKSFKSVPMIR